jgi:hypothetical protein
VQGVPAQSINWAEADDEGDLPSIANLQASFAPSGSATPVAEPVPAPVNGVEVVAATAPEPENDGFTQP